MFISIKISRIVLKKNKGSHLCALLLCDVFSCSFLFFGIKDGHLGSSQVVVHAQRALQLLHHALVEGDLLLEVGLHHVLEVHLAALVEVGHLGLQGEAHRPAPLPDAVRLVLLHLALVAHLLALLDLGEGSWRAHTQDNKNDTHCELGSSQSMNNLRTQWFNSKLFKVIYRGYGSLSMISSRILPHQLDIGKPLMYEEKTTDKPE